MNYRYLSTNIYVAINDSTWFGLQNCFIKRTFAISCNFIFVLRKMQTLLNVQWCNIQHLTASLSSLICILLVGSFFFGYRLWPQHETKIYFFAFIFQITELSKKYGHRKTMNKYKNLFDVCKIVNCTSFISILLALDIREKRKLMKRQQKLFLHLE